MLDYEPVSSHQAQAFVSGKFGPRHHDGADHTRVKQVLFQIRHAGRQPCFSRSTRAAWHITLSFR